MKKIYFLEKKIAQVWAVTLNQYQVVVHQIKAPQFYTNLSLVMDSIISEVEF